MIPGLFWKSQPRGSVAFRENVYPPFPSHFGTLVRYPAKPRKNILCFRVDPGRNQIPLDP